jgi:hypothetical protein
MFIKIMATLAAIPVVVIGIGIISVAFLASLGD